MATIRKTVTVTQRQDSFIKSHLAEGDFIHESEYIRDLLRKEQGRREHFLATKAAIEKGFNRGLSTKNVLSQRMDSKNTYNTNISLAAFPLSDNRFT